MAAIDAVVMAVSRDNADDTAVFPPPPDEEEDSSAAATADTLVASSDTDDIVVREAANSICYIDLKSKLENGSNKYRVNQNSSS